MFSVSLCLQYRTNSIFDFPLFTPSFLSSSSVFPIHPYPQIPSILHRSLSATPHSSIPAYSTLSLPSVTPYFNLSSPYASIAHSASYFPSPFPLTHIHTVISLLRLTSLPSSAFLSIPASIFPQLFPSPLLSSPYFPSLRCSPLPLLPPSHLAILQVLTPASNLPLSLSPLTPPSLFPLPIYFSPLFLSHSLPFLYYFFLFKYIPFPLLI